MAKLWVSKGLLTARRSLYPGWLYYVLVVFLLVLLGGEMIYGHIGVLYMDRNLKCGLDYQTV